MSCLWLPIEATYPDTVTLIGNLPPREIRERLGVTPDEFADMISISTAKLRDWEEGRAEPDVHDRRVMYAVLRAVGLLTRRESRGLAAGAVEAIQKSPVPPATTEIVIEAPDEISCMSISDNDGVMVTVTPDRQNIFRDEIGLEEAFTTEKSDKTWLKIGVLAQILVFKASKLEEIRDESDRLRAERSYVALAIFTSQLACEAIFGRTFGLLLARVPAALKDFDEGRNNPLLTPPPRPSNKRTGPAKGGRPSANIPERIRQTAAAACVHLIMEEDKVSEFSARKTASQMTKKAFGKKVSPSTLIDWKAEAESDRAYFAIFINDAKREISSSRHAFTKTKLQKWLNNIAISG